jgi:hypothetical protein
MTVFTNVEKLPSYLPLDVEVETKIVLKKNLLKLPILYLSRYINQNKASYYRLL